MSVVILEVCVADPASLDAAVAGGADRIELCSALELGGLTPSAGLMQRAATAGVPVHALIRPRSGDFVFSSDDIDTMRSDIAAARSAGLAGVVLGASRMDGRLDDRTLELLLAAAEGLGTTLHRAIDLAPDLAEAVDVAANLGFDRVLTSGGGARAIDSVDGLKTMLAAARGRLSIMAGGGLTVDNIGTLLGQIAIGEVHSSCATEYLAQEQGATRLGFAADVRRQTSAATVVAFKRALQKR